MLKALRGLWSAYSNFRNPFGLLFRMLRSGNRAAYFALFRELLIWILKPLDLLLAQSEKKLLQKELQSDLPVALILGSSRSGTTLLYQTLAYFLPVSYFNNLNAAFPRSPIVSSLYFNRFLKKRKSGFQNYFGSVAGLNGPNDGFHIWNRWFGTDRYWVPQQFSQEKLDQLSRFLNTWNARFKRPLLNKNNRNSMAVHHFEAAMPGKMIYLIIRRDPVFVVQSLIKSRQIVQGDKNIGWGLGTKANDERNVKNDSTLQYVDEVCKQVYEVDKMLDKVIEQVNPNRIIHISYESFCRDPRTIVQKASKMILGKELPAKKLESLHPFTNTNVQQASEEEFKQIQMGISRLYGVRTNSI